MDIILVILLVVAACAFLAVTLERVVPKIEFIGLGLFLVTLVWIIERAVDLKG